jgi:hypothetical protein
VIVRAGSVHVTERGGVQLRHHADRDAGGALTPGKHISYTVGSGEPRQKVANLLVTMLETAGVASAQLGDSTGVLPEL